MRCVVLRERERDFVSFVQAVDSAEKGRHARLRENTTRRSSRSLWCKTKAALEKNKRRDTKAEHPKNELPRHSGSVIIIIRESFSSSRCFVFLLVSFVVRFLQRRSTLLRRIRQKVSSLSS